MGLEPTTADFLEVVGSSPIGRWVEFGSAATLWPSGHKSLRIFMSVRLFVTVLSGISVSSSVYAVRGVCRDISVRRCPACPHYSQRLSTV
jgi:hypothetical protein